MMTNYDISILCKMETLIALNEKLLFGETGTYNEASDVNKEDVKAFSDVIKRQVEEKRVASEKSNQYNKEHPDRHRELARESARRKYSIKKTVR